MLGYDFPVVKEMIHSIESALLMINEDENPAIGRGLRNAADFLEELIVENYIWHADLDSARFSFIFLVLFCNERGLVWLVSFSARTPNKETKELWQILNVTVMVAR